MGFHSYSFVLFYAFVTRRGQFYQRVSGFPLLASRSPVDESDQDVRSVIVICLHSVRATLTTSQVAFRSTAISLL